MMRILSPWTEAVLFNSSGSEICCTEPGEDFIDEWRLEANGNTYIADVKEEEYLQEQGKQ